MPDYFDLIKIKRSTVTRVLVLTTATLILLGLLSLLTRTVWGHDYVYGLVPNFDLDREGNVPTYFSSLLMLLSSFLLFVISRSKQKNHDRFTLHWQGLSILFFILSIDEASSFHEVLIYPMQRTFDLPGIFYFGWVVIGIAVVLLLSLVLFKWLWSLTKQTKKQFILAAFVYLSGTIGFELIGGNYISLGNEHDLGYGLITAVEESLEMIGLILFIRGLLAYLEEMRFSLGFGFVEDI